MLKTTQVLIDDGFLNFSTGVIASSKEYHFADRCEGSGLNESQSLQR